MKGKFPKDLPTLLGMITVLFYSSIGLIFLSCLLAAVSGAVGGALLFLGVCGVIAGLALAFSRLRCPGCGGSLMPGGRLPSGLPRFCPHCGKPLQ